MLKKLEPPDHESFRVDVEAALDTLSLDERCTKNVNSVANAAGLPQVTAPGKQGSPRAR